MYSILLFFFIWFKRCKQNNRMLGTLSLIAIVWGWCEALVYGTAPIFRHLLYAQSPFISDWKARWKKQIVCTRCIEQRSRAHKMVSSWKDEELWPTIKSAILVWKKHVTNLVRTISLSPIIFTLRLRKCQISSINRLWNKFTQPIHTSMARLSGLGPDVQRHICCWCCC